MDWAKYGHVIASEYRKKIVLCLNKTPRTPKQISKDTNLYLSHVSRVLRDLKKRQMVACLTPKLKRGKVFALTDEGKEIAENIERTR